MGAPNLLPTSTSFTYAGFGVIKSFSILKRETAERPTGNHIFQVTTIIQMCLLQLRHGFYFFVVVVVVFSHLLSSVPQM